MNPLSLLVPVVMIALGLLCIVRPRLVASWIESASKADPKLQAHPSDQLTVKPIYVVAAGTVYILLVAYFFVLPRL